MKPLLRRLSFFLHRRQFESELDEEFQHHLALKAEEMENASAARRQFGNVALLKEESRTMWTFVFWEQLAQDVRYGVRAMAANKLFTAMAVLSLALGIGANTAIYSFMDAILLRTLPVPHPEELVMMKWSARDPTPVVHGVNGTMFRDEKRGRVSPNLPFAAFEALRANHDVLSTLFGYARAFKLNLIVHDQAEILSGLYVSGGYYSGLGVIPAAGRLISDDDDRSGAPPVVVLGYSYWETHFAASADAVGSKILINRIPFTVIGVSPPGFFGVDSGRDAPISIPLHAMPLFAPKPDEAESQRFFNPQFYWLETMGRLRPGVNMAQAQTALSENFRQFVLSSAATKQERTGGFPALWLQSGASGFDSLRHRYSKPLMVLMAMVGLILAIACANIANLLLSRASARRREMAVRLSLGAGRWRVVRQLLTESVLLSLAGGLLGLLVALWGIRSISWLMVDPSQELILRASLNWPVLGFTLALALGTGIVFGLAPALQATGRDVTPALKEVRSNTLAAKPGRFGLRIGLGQILVVTQVAISLILAVAAGLFVRTLTSLNSVQLGFNPDKILVFSLNAKQAGYKDAALPNFYGDLLERFSAIAGVRNAALSEAALVSQHWNDTALTVPGAAAQPENKKPSTCVMHVAASFLATMQIPILTGRGIEPRDIQAPRVAVVTELFAAKFFPGANPVGQHIGLGNEKALADIQIIGVAKTTRYNSLREETPPLVYVPYTQDSAGPSSVVFELRTAGEPLALANTVRRIVHDANPSVPVSDLSTQADIIGHTVSDQRMFASLCTGFAALALIIACVGLYGTMAYTVARRTGEIGIRMALGARRGGIAWMILRQVSILAAVGLAIGLATAWETAHFVASFLYGVKPKDPAVMAGCALVLLVAAIAAGFGPAWRAARIDPMEALRHE